MSLTNNQVKDRFMARRAGRGGNVSTDGEVFKSWNAVIAQWFHAEDNFKDKTAIVVLNGDRLSQGTTEHQGMFRRSQDPVVSFSALYGAGLAVGGTGWYQGPLDDTVQLVDYNPSLYEAVYEDHPKYKTILKNVPIGATTFEVAGKSLTTIENWRYREKGYRGYHRAGTVVLRYNGYDYLCGFDEGSYFVSKLPMQVKTVEEAFTVLIPKGAIGQEFLRQGEWFFVKAPADVLLGLTSQSQKALADEVFEYLMTRKPLLPAMNASLARGYRIEANRAAAIAKEIEGDSMGLRYTFTGFKRISTTGKALPREPRGNPHMVTYLYDTGVFLLVAGTVRHRQHRMLKLEEKTVYIAYRNNSLGDWSAAGGVD